MPYLTPNQLKVVEFVRNFRSRNGHSPTLDEIAGKLRVTKATAQGYVDDMLRTAPMGLRMTKEALNFSIDASSLDAAMAMEDRHQSLLSLTDDFVEAGVAFFERREPNYTDR